MRVDHPTAVHDTFDYEHKYAPDNQYEELFPKARVWRVYGDESSKIDIEMVAGWREGLDMLLVFVSTTFCRLVMFPNVESFAGCPLFRRCDRLSYGHLQIHASGQH